MSSMNFPDPNVTPEYKDWVWDGEKWVKDCPASGGSGGVEEAPEDGVQYARQDAAWSPVEAYDDTQIIADLNQEVADREAGDLALQGQIDALGSGGGSGWDLLHRADLAGATMMDYPDIFTDDHITYRVELREVFSAQSPFYIQGRIYSDGVLLTDKTYSGTHFDPYDALTNFSSIDSMRFQNIASSDGGGHHLDFDITFVGARPRLSPSAPKQPYLFAYSSFHIMNQKKRQISVNGVYMSNDWGDWDGFQLYFSDTAESGTALIYGLRRA